MCIISALLAALVYLGMNTWVAAREARAIEGESARIAATLRTALATPVESLYALQAYLRVRRPQPLTAAEFREFCQPAIARHPEIAALEWFPDISGAQRADFEQLLSAQHPGYEIREPTRAGDMVRAVQRTRHLALAFMEPFVPQVQGLDLAFDPLRLEPRIEPSRPASPRSRTAFSSWRTRPMSLASRSTRRSRTRVGRRHGRRPGRATSEAWRWRFFG